MKKLFLVLSLFLAGLSVQAQELDMMEVIPNDPEVRTGVLDNGASYYIRRNTKDPERANFHILYKVGAVLEEDRQDGLAHFLEHMAFNGSKNFEGNNLIEYCKSNGIEFGANLNAGTGQEMTTYMITNVPIVREGVVDSMLLVLHDWAGFITLDHDDIDDERGVISEEWRMYEAMANTRLRRQSNELLFGTDNIYNRRDIIGPLENIQGFDYQDIKDFYHKWYRPDLQAFVIVGDIDPEVIEAKLKAVMADVKAVENGAKPPKFKMEKHEEPRFGVYTDPEASSTSITLVCKLRPQPKKYANTVMSAKTELLNYLATYMINQRMLEIGKSANAPFVSSNVWAFSMNDMFDALYLSVDARPGETVEAFSASYTELLRAVRGGYATPELDRAKAELLSINEAQFNAKDDRKNQQFVTQYNNNFFDNKPFPSAEYDYELSKKLIESITIEEIEAQISSLLTQDNVVVYAYEKSGEGITNTTVAELEAAYNAVNASEIAPYVEEEVTRPLIADLTALKGSKVAKTKEGKFETTEWTLKNGLKVIVKPTDYKADEVMLQATRKGGTSNIESLEDLYSIELMSTFGQYAGLGDFTATELTRALSGKQAYAVPYVGASTEGLSGSSTVKDMETMFQLLYLRATAPRAEKTDWDVMMDKLHTEVEGALHDPMRIFQDSIQNTLFNHNPRNLVMGEEYLSKVSFEALKSQYERIYSNLGDMTFFITGSVDLETLKPLVEKYIGSLPVKKGTKGKVGKYLSSEVAKGDIVNHYTVPQESPQVIAVVVASGEVDYSMEEDLNLEVAGRVLQSIYTRTIREENSGVYVVQNAMSVSAVPIEQFINQTIYLTDSSKVFELLPLVGQGVDYITTEGPSEEELKQARLAMHKHYADNNRTNGMWQSYISSWYIWGIDNYTGYDETLDAITPQSVKEAAIRAFGQGNRIELIQLP